MHDTPLKTCRETDARMGHPAAAFACRITAAILGVCFASGCHPSPTITDNSVTIIQPGRGITNFCEIGMTFSEIREATRDATTHGTHDGSVSWKRLASWGRGRFALVPSLGAIAYIGANQPVSLVEFYVRPYRAQMIPGLEVRIPFQGKVGDKLSFKDRVVRKMEVEAVFGRVSQTATNAAEALEFRKRSERFMHRRGNGVEEFWYPHEGIAFVFVSNVVTSFQIFRAAGTNR